MDRRTMGFVSAGVLAIGTFLPIVQMPLMGSINYVANGQGDGMIVLLLAGVAALLAYFRRFRWLLAPGIASLAMCGLTIFRILDVQSYQRAQAGEALDGPTGDLARALAQSIQLEWGWAVLIAGAIGLIVTALRRGPAAAV